MRDIVGERAFEVAQAACNLYHGMLYSGRQRGAPAAQTLRELRQGAFALAEEAMEERQAREARRQARGMAAGAAGSPAATQALEAGATGEQQGSQPRTLKRERCARQQAAGGEENAAQNTEVLSPSQQQLERRRRLSGELCLAAAVSAPGWGLEEEGPQDEVEAGLATLSLCCSPEDSLHAGDEQLAGSQPVPADLSSLRMRLQAALGVASGGSG